MFKFEDENLENLQDESKKEEIVVEVEDTGKNEKQDKKSKKDFDEKAVEVVTSQEKTNTTEQNKIFKSDDTNLRRSALFNAESDLYRVKFDEYAGIPDCIVNEIFEINDGKGKITIEEAIIMLMNLIPSAKSGINEAKTIKDAIYISRIKIAAFLYKECTFGFNNIPEHSRINFSNKIKADCDKNLVYDVLYDYQLMRLSGYLPLG